MKPVTQTRTGDRGNCFASCLASIFETSLPEFGLTSDEGYDANVDKWLAKRGWQYSQTEDTSTPPIGHHTIEGISPRGGMHATVGLNGKMVWDPHPNDGTGHGLVKVVRYGLLTPLGARDERRLVVVWNEWPEGRPYQLHVEGCKDIVNRPWNVYDVVPNEQTARQNRKYNPMVTKPCVRSVPVKDSVTLRPDRYADIAANYVQAHNAASKEYKTVFASIGARMWNADYCHLLKSSNEQSLADTMRRTKSVNCCQLLPYPLTVLDSYPDVTEKQRKWLRGEVEKIHAKYQAMLQAPAKDSVTLRPDRDGEYALQYDAEPITTSKFIPGVGFHGGKVSAKSGKVVVKLDGKKIGEAGVKYEGGAWRITTLAVEPSLVGKGYGKYLYAELIRTAAENGVKELRSCSETNRSPGSEHAWNRLAETHGAVKENGTWRVKAKDILPIPLRKGRT